MCVFALLTKIRLTMTPSSSYEEPRPEDLQPTNLSMPSSAYQLKGLVAVVTGATSGIGRQQAKALAAAGASIVAIARRESELHTLAAEIEETGGVVHTLPADLLDRGALATTAASALSAFNRVDILVNSAGVNLRQPVDEISFESWDQTLNLNLAVPFFLARELVADMRKRNWGRVINIASLQSSRAFTNGLAYGASKGGVTQLTRAMAETWSADGINCNAMAPGFFPTELTTPVFNNSDASADLAARTAIGRNGQLKDLDGLTVFLASPASDYITGQTIHIDGGFTAK
jgi:NAD(P)-dependent dehydrogenase (short-subunit alcohol dehydrogenase family)